MPNPNTNKKGQPMLPTEKRGPNHAGDDPTTSGFVSCRRCHNVYNNKHWQKLDGEILKKISPEGKEEHKILCPACKMITEGLYEGQVIVNNVPDNLRLNIMDLLLSFGKKAESHDVEDRIIEIRNVGQKIIVTTTENQLAQKLAKKINQTFKNSDIHISYSSEPNEVVRAVVLFKS